jgi:hypothetical protein
MKTYIFALPRDVLRTVANYLLENEEQNKQIFSFNSEWRNFMNSSKEQFWEWKIQSQIVILRGIYAQQFSQSREFRERISQTIQKPEEQLKLAFRFIRNSNLTNHLKLKFLGIQLKNTDPYLSIEVADFPKVVREIDFDGYHVTNIENCPPVRKFKYTDFQFPNPAKISTNVSSLRIIEEATFSYINLLNYHTLSHLQSLSISYTNSIADVSCFKSIKKLGFIECPNITDESSLRDVRDLQLSRCQGVTDVSALGRVYSLNLMYSNSFRDISALNRFRTLNLSECLQVDDVSSLTNVYDLHLYRFQGSYLSSLRSVERMELWHCPNIIDITMLTTLKELAIYHCPQILCFHGLSNLRNLTVCGTDNKVPFKVDSGIAVFSNLEELCLFEMNLSENTDALEVNTSTNLRFQHFKNLKKLSLAFCCFNEILQNTFSSLCDLTIRSCNFNSSSIPFIPFLKVLKIYYCQKLTDLEILGDGLAHGPKKSFSTDVEVSSCGELKQISIHRAVSRLKVNFCPQLQDITMNRPIGSLQAKRCPKLNTPIFVSDHKRC